jgi:cell division protein FtsZ
MDGYSQTAVIKVLGIGGGGGNAVAHMVRAGIEGVDFICANTDAQALKGAKVKTGLQIGCNITKGLGAGANPEVGRQAAMEDRDRIQEVIEGADMLFITAGLGGGTGTGAAPVVAQLAKEMGILTVAVVTKPFGMEGPKRVRVAEQGIAELGRFVDSLITIPNEKLLSVLGPSTTLLDAFRSANEVLQGAVQGIAELITRPGLINVDFADVRTIMTGMGRALMGTGYGTGDKRAIEAAQQAISSPLLEDVSINGATGILLNITGGPDLTLAEMNEACSLIAEAADPEANIIFGSVIDAHAGDQVRITVIATGFNAHAHEHPSQSQGGGRGTTRGREGQMALPMQASAIGQAPTMMAQQPMGPWGQTSNPTPRGGYAAPAQRPGDSGESINRDDFYTSMADVPPAAMGAVPTQPNGPEWTPSERPERPVVRPPQAPNSVPAGGRRSAQMQSPRPGDELGVEESEFDKPTYLRRGLYAPE